MLKTQDIQEFISQNKERLQFDSWVSIEHRFLFVNNPKAGCTKVKKLLQALSGFDVPEDVGAIHGRNGVGFVKSIMDYSLSEQIYLLESPDVCRFSFVRNPYERTLSAYRSKVVGPKKYGFIQEDLISIRTTDETGLPSFQEFVDFVFKQDDTIRDIHWKSQYADLHFDKINYNYVGRFEFFQRDLHTLLVKLKADEKLFSSISKVENASAGITMEEAYSVDLRAKINSMYDIDFKTFNYNKILN